MKTATLSSPNVSHLVTTVPIPDARPVSRFADYVALTKPRISVLVLFTVGAGVLFAAGPEVSLLVLFHAVFGTALVASGASALNQWLEQHTDARMKRTRIGPCRRVGSVRSRCSSSARPSASAGRRTSR